MSWKPLRWLIAAAFYTIVAVPPPAVAGRANSSINDDFDVQPGQELRIDLEGIRGDVDITGWNQNRVEIRGRIGGRGWEDDDELVLDQSSAGIDIAPDYRHHRDNHIRLELHIKVPQEFDVSMRAATDTRIKNLDGRVDVSIGNADLELEGVHGKCDLSAANGHLKVTRCTLDGDIGTANGRLTLDDSDITGDISSVNGGVSVSRAPETIDVSSTNGGVKIGSAGSVHAETVNGAVSIGELAGWIEAETVNGSVELRMVGAPDGKRSIDIETLNGHVEVEIPENFSMDFDVEVDNRDRGGHYEIVSDFDLDVKSEDAGRRHYVIRGKGSIGGGRNSVRIRATNGDVILKRIASSR